MNVTNFSAVMHVAHSVNLKEKDRSKFLNLYYLPGKL